HPLEPPSGPVSKWREQLSGRRLRADATPCDMLLESRPVFPNALLAAVDFSEPSRLALVLAARLARQCSATLTVFHAEDPLLSAAAQAEGIALAEETRVELARFVRSAPPAGDIDTRYDVATGPAATAVIDAAARDADLIVIG